MEEGLEEGDLEVEGLDEEGHDEVVLEEGDLEVRGLEEDLEEEGLEEKHPEEEGGLEEEGHAHVEGKELSYCEEAEAQSLL